MAQRHVWEGQARIAQQHAIVVRLREHSLPTEMAEAVLATFETAQNLRKDHLVQLGGYP
jgi:hypothetical protein